MDLHGTLLLTCRFDGVPKPFVIWLHNNTIKREDSDSRVSILTDSANGSTVLNINDLKLTDTGLYSCVFTSPGNIYVLNVTTLIVKPCK